MWNWTQLIGLYVCIVSRQCAQLLTLPPQHSICFFFCASCFQTIWNSNMLNAKIRHVPYSLKFIHTFLSVDSVLCFFVFSLLECRQVCVWMKTEWTNERMLLARIAADGETIETTSAESVSVSEMLRMFHHIHTRAQTRDRWNRVIEYQ